QVGRRGDRDEIDVRALEQRVEVGGDEGVRGAAVLGALFRRLDLAAPDGHKPRPLALLVSPRMLPRDPPRPEYRRTQHPVRAHRIASGSRMRILIRGAYGFKRAAGEQGSRG